LLHRAAHVRELEVVERRRRLSAGCAGRIVGRSQNVTPVVTPMRW
jgi:hypothetical protein